MIELTQKLDSQATPQAVLRLPFDTRQKSRFRACLEDGTDVGVFMPRGTLLRGGDRLQASDGRVVEVQAADEPVSTARTDDPHSFARACYHLGNRHVPLQIGDGWLRYRHDHVLDAMTRALGLEVIAEEAPFEPEPGAYGDSAMLGGHHHHGHHHHEH